MKKPLEVSFVVHDEGIAQSFTTLAEAQEYCDEMNAPKVMKPKYTKEFNYFGLNLHLPDDAKWLATDNDCVIYYYTEKPILSEMVFLPSTNDSTSFGRIVRVDLNGIDWCDTLVEVK